MIQQGDSAGGGNASANGLVLATGGYDFSVRLWQVATGACAKVCHHTESHVISLAITADRRMVAAAGYQGIRLYDTVGTSQSPTTRFDRLPKNVMCVGFNKTNQWMYSGGEDGFARIFDLRVRPQSAPGGTCCLKVDRPVMSMALHPTKPEMFVGVQTGGIHVMDLRTLWNEEWSIEGSEVAILSLSPHPSGQLLAAATSGGMIYLYTVGDSQPYAAPSPRDSVPPSFNQQPNNSATIGSVSQLSARPFALQAHARHVLKCAFSPDGRFLATVSADKTAKIWRVWMAKSTQSSPCGDGATDLPPVQIGVNYVCELPHPPPRMWIWDCAWAADSQHIFTACADNVVRLWALPPEVTAGTTSSPPSPSLSPPCVTPPCFSSGESSPGAPVPRATLAMEYHGHQKPVVALAYADH